MGSNDLDHWRAWLAGSRNQPVRLLKINVFCYAFFQVVAWALLGDALVHHRPSALMLFCINTALPPFFMWATFRSVRTAWLQMPPDDARDGAIPFVVVSGAAVCLWLLLT